MMHPDFGLSPVCNKPVARICNNAATDGGHSPALILQSLRVLLLFRKKHSERSE